MPVDIQTLLIFIPIAFALNLTPGPDMLFCLGEGSRSGPRAGLAAALGVTTGLLILSVAAGLGVAAVLATHSLAFEIVRWAGVLYLLWQAIQIFRHPPGHLYAAPGNPSDLYAAWRKGVLVCTLNPKVTLFILALVPQFVDPAKGSVFLQFLIFGVIIGIGGTFINGSVGAFAGGVGRFLQRNPYVGRIVHYGSGLLFVGLAAKLAFERR